MSDLKGKVPRELKNLQIPDTVVFDSNVTTRTRSCRAFFTVFETTVESMSPEPSSYREAIESEEHEQWEEAINNEMNALKKNLMRGPEVVLANL